MTATLPVRVRPGRARDSIAWDEWRAVWTISCREPAQDGRANRRVADLLAGWLELPSSAVVLSHPGRSPDKVVLVEGLSLPEIHARLERAEGAGDRADG